MLLLLAAISLRSRRGPRMRGLARDRGPRRARRGRRMGARDDVLRTRRTDDASDVGDPAGDGRRARGHAPRRVATGIPADLDGGTLSLLAVAGTANLVGLLLVVTALRAGKVGIVAPIVSTEGAIAATLAVIAGEALAPGAGVTLAVIAIGIAFASAGSNETAAVATRLPGGVLLAVAAAFSFGISLYATGRVSDDLSIPWALLPARVVGVLFLFLPLLALGRLRATRDALPFVVTAGVAEVIGFAAFTYGARDGIAISAVLASQFGVVAAAAAFLLLGERLTRRQTAGIATIAVGVALLTWIQA